MGQKEEKLLSFWAEWVQNNNNNNPNKSTASAHACLGCAEPMIEESN